MPSPLLEQRAPLQAILDQRDATITLLSRQDPASVPMLARLVTQYRTHEKDTGSPEVQVALLSERITQLTDERDRARRIAVAAQGTVLRITDAGIFWPTSDSGFAYLADVSDHHLVWVDLAIPGVRKH